MMMINDFTEIIFLSPEEWSPVGSLGDVHNSFSLHRTDLLLPPEQNYKITM